MRAWLLRIHDAASRRNFQGTFVVSGGGSVASARISHFCDGPNQYERIESLDGRQRKVFRHNDVVHTLWPASKVAMVEQRGHAELVPGAAAGRRRLASPSGTRCAPRASTGSPATRPTCSRSSRATAYRYGYRLWADRASGLLLRADVIGERGEVLETSAFSDVVDRRARRSPRASCRR